MRISKEQAKQNQERMIKAAAELFRERGFDGVGVVELMKNAGFTHGGFYNHFDSKEDLVAEAARRAFRQLEEFRAGKEIDEVLSDYLSAAHRTERRRGCPASALSGDASRQPERVKKVFAAGIEGMIREYMKLLGPTSRPEELRDRAINMLATAVGAVVLARAIPSKDALSQEILDVNLEACLKNTMKPGGSPAAKKRRSPKARSKASSASR
jgi:TetR/AcrR family transcriptional regulator, transcriptional repressor for nem operon